MHLVCVDVVGGRRGAAGGVQYSVGVGRSRKEHLIAAVTSARGGLTGRAAGSAVSAVARRV